MGETVVRAEGVRWAPGLVRLEHVDLEVTAGTATAVVGPNGSGKSLLLLLLSALALPDDGRLQVLGFDPQHEPRAVYARVARVAGEPVDWGLIGCRDALRTMDAAHGLPRAGRDERVARLLELTRLTEHARTKVAELPTAFKRRLGLAVALVNDPMLLLLDDPLTGVDAATREVVAAVVDDRLRAGHTVVLTALAETDLTGIATTEIRLDAGRTDAAPAEARVVAPRQAPDQESEETA